MSAGDLVSVCLLTYNHEKYICDAINSIINQTYKNIEIIILDDCSCDQTPNYVDGMIEKIEDRFTYYKIIKHEANRGSLPANVNEMVKCAQGDYIKCLSGDDILLPDAIENLKDALEQHASCAMVHADVIEVDDTYKIHDYYRAEKIFPGYERDGLEGDTFFYRLMHGNCVAAPSVMIRRAAFQKYGLFREDLPYEDYEYWLRIGRNEDIFYLAKSVVLYRRVASSMTNFSIDGERKWIVNVENQIKTLDIYINDFSLNEQDEIWRSNFKQLYSVSKENKYESALELIEREVQCRGVEFSKESQNVDYKELYRKSAKVSALLDRWMAKRILFKERCKELDLINKKVIIYGYSIIGRRLKTELENQGVEISFIIDRQEKLLRTDIPVFKLEDKLPEADFIFLTFVDRQTGVEETLKKKEPYATILYVDDLLH